MAYAALALIALLVPSGPAPVGRKVVLTLPHELHAGEMAWLEVKVGVIERGADVAIKTEEGDLLGVISPYAIRTGHPAGIYTVPVPVTAISKNRVVLRIVFDDYQRPKRAPTSKEVPEIRIRITAVP
jgi:hypothetical protein